MSELAAILRAAALLLEQQARVIDYTQAAEGRLADAEHEIARVGELVHITLVQLRTLEETLARFVEQQAHRLAERERGG